MVKTLNYKFKLDLGQMSQVCLRDTDSIIKNEGSRFQKKDQEIQGDHLND